MDILCESENKKIIDKIISSKITECDPLILNHFLSIIYEESVDYMMIDINDICVYSVYNTENIHMYLSHGLIDLLKIIREIINIRIFKFLIIEIVKHEIEILKMKQNFSTHILDNSSKINTKYMLLSKLIITINNDDFNKVLNKHKSFLLDGSIPGVESIDHFYNDNDNDNDNNNDMTVQQIIKNIWCEYIESDTRILVEKTNTLLCMYDRDMNGKYISGKLIYLPENKSRKLEHKLYRKYRRYTSFKKT